MSESNSTRISSAAALPFTALASADVLSLAFGGESAARVLKPFLMPSLGLWAFCSLKADGIPFRRMIPLLAGLLFHTIGDVLLMHNGPAAFMAGMGAFMAGHLCYLSIMWKWLAGAPAGLKSVTVAAAAMLPLLIVPWFEGSSMMLFGVDIYSAVLLGLVAVPAGAAVWRKDRSDALTALAGGVSFVISDFLIALGVFLGADFPLRHCIVMLTYLAAEALIATSLVRAIRKASCQAIS